MSIRIPEGFGKSFRIFLTNSNHLILNDINYVLRDSSFGIDNEGNPSFPNDHDRLIDSPQFAENGFFMIDLLFSPEISLFLLISFGTKTKLLNFDG